MVKIEHQKSSGSQEPLLILEWKGDEIAMDFVIGLQRSRQGNDAILVIIGRWTKFARFPSIQQTDFI